MALRTITDKRLTKDNNLTNVLSSNTNEQSDSKDIGDLTGVPGKEKTPGVTTTTTAQSDQKQTQQQKSNIATKAPKQPARSGMFTNIKQYMEKNKPVIEKMGQQAGGQFATTAEKIKQQASGLQQSYQDRLRESQEAIRSQLTGGQQAIEDIISPVQTATEVPETQETEVTTPAQPEVEQPATLADYGKAAENLAASTSALNLEDQIKEASKLQQQASGILSDAGRRDLLRDVFGRGTRQYTSGAQALDNLLLAASPDAGRKLKETVTSASRGLEDITRQQQAGAQALQELQQQASGVGDILGRQSEQAIASQMEGVAGSKKSYLQERKGILEDIISGANQMVQNRLDFLSDYSFKPVKDSNNIIQYSNPLSLNYFDRQGLDKLGYDRDKFKEIIKNAPRRLEKFKEVKDTWESHDTGFGETYLHSKEQKKEHNETIDNYMDEIREYFKAGANPEMESVNGMEINPYALKAINQYLSKENRPTLSDLVSGSDIDPEGFYGFSDKNIAKINAIRRLRGEEEIVPSQSYYSLEDLQNLLGDKGGYERQNLYDYILSPYYKL